MGLYRIIVLVVAGALVASAAAAPPAPLISVPSALVSGQAFSASFDGVRPNVYPWGHLTCEGGLDEWRADQGDGTIGVFELLGVQAGEVCVIDLVDLKRDGVLASVSFTVQ